MSSSTSVFTYFLQAGLVVKAVMLILSVVSIISWTLIIQRAWYFKQKKQQHSLFTRKFWDSRNLKQLFSELDNDLNAKQGLTAIFYAGFKEYIRSRQQGKVWLESIQRAMQIRQNKEAIQFEQYMPFLATVGSLSPYIGLFGTVWGIMSSLQAIGQAQQATIAMVAPGMAEALVATALGLFTAIPAIIALNHYTTQANFLLDSYSLFQEELIALIEQQTETPG